MGRFQITDFMTPTAGFAALVGVVIGILLLKNLRNARFLLSIILAFGAMGMTDDQVETKHGTVVKHFLVPLVSLRQPLFLGMGLLLGLGAAAHMGRLSASRISGASYGLIAVGCFVGLAQFYHAGAVDGMATIAIALITLGVPALVVPSVLDEYDDFMRCIRAIAFAGVIWNLCVAAQFVINPSALTLGASKRFMGMGANPQHAASFLALVGTCSLFLTLNESHQRFRLLWLAQAAVCAAFIGWAGSRTGAAMLVIGSVAVLYRRLGRAVLLLPVVAVIFAVAVKVIQSFSFNVGTERLMSTQDTRSAVWRNMLESGLNNPMLGVGTRNAGGSENSFLLAFASFGVGGLLCSLFLLAVVAVNCWQLLRVRGLFEPAAGRLVDLQIGLFGAFFAGALFEGYLVARVSSMTVMFILFASMSSRLVAIAKQGATSTPFPLDTEYGPSDAPSSVYPAGG